MYAAGKLYGSGASSFNPMESKTLLALVGGCLALVVVGTALGLGLGIGLHNDSGNLTLVTSTTSTTMVSTTITTTASTLSSYQGSLSSSSPVYGGVNQSSVNYTYEALEVLTNTAGTYQFTGTGATGVKLYGYLYDTNFTVTSPLTNLIAQDNSNTGSLQFSLSSALQAIHEYVLVVTTANQSTTGAFNITASGPGTVSFIRRNIFSNIATYGSTVNNGVDDTTSEYVTINTNDVVTGIDGVLITGYVTQVSMAFFAAPTAGTASIYIYVMDRTGSTLTFTPADIYQIPVASISATTGIQSYSIPRNELPIVTGQYVAIGMDTNAGSLAGVQNQTQAHFGTTNFITLAAATYTEDTTGIAFQYQVFLVGVVQG